jgi:hypothetical protein
MDKTHALHYSSTMTLQRILQSLLTSCRLKKNPEDEAARLFETKEHFYHNTMWHNPENSNIHI